MATIIITIYAQDYTTFTHALQDADTAVFEGYDEIQGEAYSLRVEGSLNIDCFEHSDERNLEDIGVDTQARAKREGR